MNKTTTALAIVAILASTIIISCTFVAASASAGSHHIHRDIDLSQSGVYEIHYHIETTFIVPDENR